MIDFSYTMPSGINAGKSVEDVFWKQVSKNGPIPADKALGECWVWTGKKFNNGYGCFIYKGRYFLAHRVSWELATGYIGTLFILHRCDNPECIRHDHHFEGTAKDNSDDKIQKREHHGES